MKKYILIPMFAMLAVAGCTQLSAEDSAVIATANKNAQEAKQQSAEALAEAKAARVDADKSAEKADRIFRQGQNK